MKINSVKIFFLLAIFFAMPNFAKAAPIPVLNFSDITSGPKTGNTDGAGSGAIVTIWGNNLGAYIPGTSKVYVGNVEATAIYYWKNADGTLPGGPAQLSAYHKMQEIAFAVPSGAANGSSPIKVTVGGVDSNTLPFTVRTGNIRFVKTGGSDSNTGTWSSPWATLNGAMDGQHATTGDTVYSVGIGSTTGIKLAGNASLTGTSSNPIALIAYPNTSIAVSGHGGAAGVVTNWYPSARNNDYVHLSKLSITASQTSGDLDNNPLNGINAVSHGRVIGVAITGPTVYGGYGGAIAGTEGHAEGGVYLGVYIHHYGLPTPYSYNWDSDTWTSSPYNYSGGVCTNCTSVDRFQHLYYINHRVSQTQGEAYEIGWNHLTDNPILSGIHIYDMGDSGGWAGTITIHHNVVKNQRGGSIDCINTGSAGVTHLDVYNNLFIVDANEPYNHGRAFDFGAAVIKFYNNTVYGYSWPNQLDGSNADFRNNLMVDNRGNVALTSHTPNTYSNNMFYSLGSTTKPSWVTTTANPLFANAGAYDFSLQATSPAINAGYNTTATVPTDFFGQPRQSGSVSIGAFQYVSSVSDTTAPSAPSRLSVQ